MRPSAAKLRPALQTVPMDRVGGQQHTPEEGSHTMRSAAGLSLWRSGTLAGLPDAPQAALAEAFAVASQAALRRVHRRATLLWPGAPGVIVKRYERGVWRDALSEWRERGSVRSFARREAENLQELARAGLPTPRALGWCGSDGWRGVARPSALWMERVEHRTDLREELTREPTAAARWRDPLARLVARLHAQGWRHRDLYLQHWLVGSCGLVLIDVGRCEREPQMRERWFVKDLAALEMSCPTSVSARSRLRFAARYFKERGVAKRTNKRDLLSAVRSKARRMAAHEPRYVDPSERSGAVGRDA